MKTETGLNHRKRASVALRDLFSCARIGCYRHQQIMSAYEKITASIAHCPVWVKAFVEGQYRLLSDLHYDNLEFCYIQDTGDNTPPILFSTHKDTEKRSTDEWYEAGKGAELGKLKSGFFYRDTYNKPFFTENR